MQKMLISVPEPLAIRLRSIIPPRQRSQVISHLIEKEIEKREKKLYECALEVEGDKSLNREMKRWETQTLQDGLNHESW